jgi:cytochrome c oxidase subunit 4
MSSHADPSSAPAPHGDGYAHVVPVRVLMSVLVALLVLTYLTVYATYFDLGNWNLAVAMAIATVKALLVALYFMHLRYDKPFYLVVLLIAVAFLFLFITITLFDTVDYQNAIRARTESLD